MSLSANMLCLEEYKMKSGPIVKMGMALAAILGLSWLLGIDVAQAAVPVVGTSKLGVGVTEAGASVGTLLTTIVGPLLAVGIGLAAGAATRAGGGSMGGSAATGVGTGAVVAFIPVAATSTYTTSGSAAFSLHELMVLADAVPFYRDPTVPMIAIGLFMALFMLRRVKEGQECRLSQPLA